MKLNRNFPRGGAGFSLGGSGYFLEQQYITCLFSGQTV